MIVNRPILANNLFGILALVKPSRAITFFVSEPTDSSYLKLLIMVHGACHSI